MKYLTFALVFLSLQFASAQPLVSSSYKGQADRAIRLNTEEGTALLGYGAVDVTIKRVNPLRAPLQFVKGSRLLVIKNDMLDTFQFLIPGNVEIVNDEVHVTSEESSQLANLTIREERKLIESTEEVHKDGCSKADYCYMCGMGADGKSSCGFKYSTSCPGSKDVLYRVEKYDRSLELTLANSSEAVRIVTEGTAEFKNIPLKVVRGCH